MARKCGNCGETGHNVRTCPHSVEQEEEETYYDEEIVIIPKPRKKRSYSCKLCGEKDDHRADSCPYRPVPAGKVIGPTVMECGHNSWWFEKGQCQKCRRKNKKTKESKL